MTFIAPKARVREKDTKIELRHHFKEDGRTVKTSLRSQSVRQHLTAMGRSARPKKKSVANSVTSTTKNCFWVGDYVFSLLVR